MRVTHYGLVPLVEYVGRRPHVNVGVLLATFDFDRPLCPVGRDCGAGEKNVASRMFVRAMGLESACYVSLDDCSNLPRTTEVARL